MSTTASETPVRVDAVALSGWVAEVLRSVGLDGAAAATIAGHIVEADARGFHSHGADLLPAYHRGFAEGELDATGAPRTERRSGAMAAVDGRNTLGHLAADHAMDVAIELARESGIGMVTVHDSNHFGMAGSWPLKAIRHGLVGFATTNGPPVMTPWGGREAVICNNPFAWGIPARAREPILLDMACTAGARGRVRLARQRDEHIPAGWALGADGAPTTDPADALAGVMLPFGEHKGSGLAIVNEILSAGLSGAGFLGAITSTTMASAGIHPAWRIGHCFVVIDPGALRPLDDFLGAVDAVVDELKRTPPAAGVAEVLMPGERGFRQADESARLGIAMPVAAWEHLSGFADEVGLPLPSPITDERAA